MQITSGIIGGAQKVVLYGPEGIGKTTFAACMPEPVFIDTEGSTVRYNVRRLPAPKSWTALMEEVAWCVANPEALKTLVIDTADWAERLCIQHILDTSKAKSIEDFGYGKGYVMVKEEFGKLLNLLTDVTHEGVHVLLNAHAMMRKFEQPDDFGSYDRWELKLSRQVAPMVKEWADMLLFANYEVYVVADGKTGSRKAQGGNRVLFTSHNPCWDAKNRENLPEKMAFDYALLAKCFETLAPDRTVLDVTESDAALAAMSRPEAAPPKTPPEAPKTVPHTQADILPPGAQEQQEQAPAARPAGIPDALWQLMQQDDIKAEEIAYAVALKGYFPHDMPIASYPPDFIQGVLIGAWPQVRSMVLENRKECPF